uniref:Thiol:disulfide interchange protein n=1 Tax=Candidatus Aschnera chinzeii TaxID=1485666 RepID=A0AAT9G5B5_9ENTR|nr:MAG: thiol:disulfide interchange protein DsbA [Candidatus Aschnera chinzeii]
MSLKMNKFYLILILISLSFSSYTKNYFNGIDYIEISNQVSSAPTIVEFFSFYCHYCYEFEFHYHIIERIKNKLNNSIQIERYHVNSGPLGRELTEAWVIANLLKKEKIIFPLLFNAIQKNKSIHNKNDITKLFLQAGISIADYNSALNSVLVKIIIKKQELIRNQFQVNSVPSIYVNGKYKLCNIKLNNKNNNNHIQYDINLINFLIKK